MISIAGKIISPVFKYLKGRYEKQKQTLEQVRELTGQVKEQTGQIELLTERIVGELSFAKTITKHDKEIAVLEGSMKAMQGQVDNVQQTTSIMFKIIDRTFGRAGNPDRRPKKKERRKK